MILRVYGRRMGKHSAQMAEIKALLNLGKNVCIVAPGSTTCARCKRDWNECGGKCHSPMET